MTNKSCRKYLEGNSSTRRILSKLMVTYRKGHNSALAGCHLSQKGQEQWQLCFRGVLLFCFVLFSLSLPFESFQLYFLKNSSVFKAESLTSEPVAPVIQSSTGVILMLSPIHSAPMSLHLKCLF